uniref:Gallid herpesvirus antisense RNA n=1 Tax=Infectious laryngotracheitis virus TaxID=10386 RepID=Q69293_ILTV|nr:orf4 [Gallid alphaherpesvirus 1]
MLQYQARSTALLYVSDCCPRWMSRLMFSIPPPPPQLQSAVSGLYPRRCTSNSLNASIAFLAHKLDRPTESNCVLLNDCIV